MGNGFGGGGRVLYLSNGGTTVFVEVLMPAVSDLAESEWDHRFAALLNLQDQRAMGRGAVGFDLEEIDWGETVEECARAKAFVLRAVDLALTRHRWDELSYDPPFAPDHLRRFRALVDSFDPVPGDPRAACFPAAHERAVACCVRHRILTALPLWDGCLFCGEADEG
ncbi:hypothetical protein ACN20G_35055 (plasmid) [Streptomyces sp. BI20]|uniref:hypothetical protein n=1 Tax=Streptomyces sp. BI20 TaxID=3403460 RepID=UPI003C709870